MRKANEPQSGFAPADASHDHLIERRISSQQVFAGGFLQVFRDEAELPDGLRVNREYIRHPGAAVVVPVLDDGRLVMERQFRYPLQKVLLEFPAGKIESGEPIGACVQRELLEETGYTAREWALAGRLHNAAAYSDEFIELWFARGLTSGTQRLDVGELLEVCLMEPDAVMRLAAKGELTDAKTMIGLLWLEHWKQGRWEPRWMSAEQAARS